MLNVRGAAVPEPDPHHLGWRPPEKTALAEVVVLRYDHEPLGRRMGPDLLVAGRCESEVTHVRGVRVQVGKPRDQPRRQVLIEQELQVAAPAPGGPTRAGR